ncbi:MAG: VIT domain-containing protein [Candidatus Promineifilaceae bacterium]|nr:VIT domain-containing protein [Candidatus Promineifilaceae bacterium]
MKKITFILILFLSLLFAAGATPASAQDATRPPAPSEPLPPPPIWDTGRLRIAYQRVDVTIEDQVATTHIEQLFVNEGDGIAEGVYLFPLPEGAAVNQLTMWVDGQPIEAKILEAGEARAIYDEIVRQLRDPALLEYVGTGAIQANVFPIPAQDERRIEIEYTQILPADNGLIHYVYPQSTDLYTNAPLDTQSIRVDVRSDEAIRAIYSPSHPVAVNRDGEFQATAGYEASDVTAEKDFELYYSVSPEEIGLNLLSYKEAGEDGFFLMLVAPTVEVDPEDVVAKDVILVLDTSGSMEGEKMAQAKEAARYVVQRLNPQDRFNVVAFSTGVRTYAPELIPAADAADALPFIDRLEAIGGTNISLALLEAMNQADAERPLTVIFLTDGLATEGIVETPLLLDAVGEAAPSSARLFAFGVGNDVDTLLLDGLTENHRGTTTYVRPGEAIDEAVSGFYAKVSTPVLADVTLEVDGVTVERLYPAELPDLFAGTQLAVAGRYRQGGPATITLRGELNGETQTFVYEDNVFRSQGGDQFIPRLWATRAIGHLLQQIRLHGENEELVQSVVNLSIRYGIITPYTSYLIEEEDIFTQSGRDMIVDEEMAAAEEPAPVTGAEAVDEAEEAGELAAAEAPQPVEVTRVVTEVEVEGEMVEVERRAIETVGSKTFVYRDGVWIDTAFEADSQTPQRVGFASDAYFDLLSAAPELGQYMALGPRVLVVYDGVAYEIVEGEGQTEITLPEVTATGETSPAATEATPALATTEPESVEETPAGGRSSLCTAALILPLFLSGAIIFSRRRHIWRRS